MSETIYAALVSDGQTKRNRNRKRPKKRKAKKNKTNATDNNGSKSNSVSALPVKHTTPAPAPAPAPAPVSVATSSSKNNIPVRPLRSFERDVGKLECVTDSVLDGSISARVVPHTLQSIARYLVKNPARLGIFLHSRVLSNVVAILMRVSRGSIAGLTEEETRNCLKLGDAIVITLVPDMGSRTQLDLHLQRILRELLASVAALPLVPEADFAKYVVSCFRSVHPAEHHPSSLSQREEATLDGLVRQLKMPTIGKPTVSQLVKRRDIAQAVMDRLQSDDVPNAATHSKNGNITTTVPSPGLSLGVKVTEEDAEIIETVSRTLKEIDTERDSALTGHSRVLDEARAQQRTLQSEREKLVTRLRLVDKKLSELAETAQTAEISIEEVNATHKERVAELEGSRSGQQKDIKSALARRNAESIITKFRNSLIRAGNAVRKKAAADGAAVDKVARGGHMECYFHYAAYYFENEVTCIRTLRIRNEAQKRKLADVESDLKKLQSMGLENLAGSQRVELTKLQDSVSKDDAAVTKMMATAKRLFQGVRSASVANTSLSAQDQSYLYRVGAALRRIGVVPKAWQYSQPKPDNLPSAVSPRASVNKGHGFKVRDKAKLEKDVGDIAAVKSKLGWANMKPVAKATKSLAEIQREEETAAAKAELARKKSGKGKKGKKTPGPTPKEASTRRTTTKSETDALKQQSNTQQKETQEKEKVKAVQDSGDNAENVCENADTDAGAVDNAEQKETQEKEEVKKVVQVSGDDAENVCENAGTDADAVDNAEKKEETTQEKEETTQEKEEAKVVQVSGDDAENVCENAGTDADAVDNAEKKEETTQEKEETTQEKEETTQEKEEAKAVQVSGDNAENVCENAGTDADAVDNAEPISENKEQEQEIDVEETVASSTGETKASVQENGNVVSRKYQKVNGTQVGKTLHADFAPTLTGADSTYNEYVTYSDDKALGQSCPDLKTLNYVQGDPLKVGDGRIKIIFFWAKYLKWQCWPTMSGMCEINEMHPEVDVVGIAADKKQKDVDRFLEKGECRADCALAFDANWVLKDAFKKLAQTGALAVPCAFLINGEGTIVWRQSYSAGYPFATMGFYSQLQHLIAGEPLQHHCANPDPEEDFENVEEAKDVFATQEVKDAIW